MRGVKLTYRLYAVTAAGRIHQPPMVIGATNDDEAVEKARALLDGRDVDFGTETDW